MAHSSERVSLSRLFQGLGRILSLAETVLSDLAGAPPDAESFRRYPAFSWDAERGPGRLVPVERPADFALSDLVGVDSAVSQLLRNAQQFMLGVAYNHVLLFGERGTGKSSAVRGLLTRFAGDGLRLVEVKKSDLLQLSRILSALEQAGRDYRFLIFCDDLSFGSGESGFRELKAALEGGIHGCPDNVLMIATSNRRHLLPESMGDNRGAALDGEGELHLGEALDEKLALSDRFGLVLGFYAFNQETYLRIVAHYIEKEKLEISPEDVRGDALRWALNRDSRSGRTARHFVNDLAGRLALECRSGRAR